MQAFSITSPAGVPWIFQLDQSPISGLGSRTFIGSGTAPGARATLYTYSSSLYYARIYGHLRDDADHVSASSLSKLLRGVLDACDRSDRIPPPSSTDRVGPALLQSPDPSPSAYSFQLVPQAAARPDAISNCSLARGIPDRSSSITTTPHQPALPFDPRQPALPFDDCSQIDQIGTDGPSSTVSFSQVRENHR